MNHSPESHNDPLDLLRAANPVPETAADPIDSPAVQQRFQEITMTATPETSNPTTPATPAESAGTNPPRFEHRAVKRDRRRRRGMTAVAAAAVTAVAFGAATLVPGSTPAAAAAVLEAAERTEAADSGVMVVDFDIEDGDERMQQQVTLAFDGRDLSASLAGGEGDDSGFGGAGIELVVVDNTTYARLGDMQWLELDDSPMAALTTSGLPSDIRNSVSERLIDIVKEADNVEEVGDNHYIATTTMAEIGTLTQVIPGFDPLDMGDMPEEANEVPVDVDLLLDDDGYIDLVTVAIDGAEVSEAADDPELADMAVSVTVDFQDMGSDQAIVAPADAQPFSLDGLDDDFDRTEPDS